jgi:predicted Zn-dependent peptidase
LATDELDAAKDFCTGQWTTAFDDSDALADLLVQQLSLGRDLFAVSRFPAELAAAAAAEVCQAWERLFDPSVLTGAVVDRRVVDPASYGWSPGPVSA